MLSDKTICQEILMNSRLDSDLLYDMKSKIKVDISCEMISREESDVNLNIQANNLSSNNEEIQTSPAEDGKALDISPHISPQEVTIDQPKRNIISNKSFMEVSRNNQDKLSNSKKRSRSGSRLVKLDESSPNSSSNFRSRQLARKSHDSADSSILKSSTKRKFRQIKRPVSKPTSAENFPIKTSDADKLSGVALSQTKIVSFFKKYER